MRLHKVNGVFLTLAALAVTCLTSATSATWAMAPFVSEDFSGVYDCAGQDDHEGAYSGVVTLQRVSAQSTGSYGAYKFTLDVPGYGSYPGQAAAKGRSMAIHFANVDPATQDFGTGIATFKRGPTGRWMFEKYYFEPEYKGGNFGFENCLQR